MKGLGICPATFFLLLKNAHFRKRQTVRKGTVCSLTAITVVSGV